MTSWRPLCRSVRSLQVGDAGQLLGRHQFLDLGDHPLGADVVGQRGDDQALAARRDVLDRRGGPHLEGAAAGPVGVADAAQAVDVAAGRQVGTRDEVHQVVERRVGVFQQAPRGGHDLDQVVGAMLVAMPTAMPVEPLTSRLGNADPRTDRLGLLAVVVGREVDRVLVDRLHHQHRRVGQAGLGVAHGGRQVVGRAEVAVAVDQRQPHRERLGLADQRVVDRAVAVGVELTHDLADDAGRLHVAPVGAQPPSPSSYRGCGAARA